MKRGYRDDDDPFDNGDDIGAVPVERGCGVRVQNGVYSECGLSPYGTPIEQFLIEGVPLPPELENLPEIGVMLIEVDGVYHVLDHVSEKDYPSPADIIEEIRRFGMSRRCEGIDYSKLSAESKHILVHPRAFIANAAEYGVVNCPKGHEHAPGEMCSDLWWRDLDSGSAAPTSDQPSRVVRERPSFTYNGLKRPDNVTPEYRRGFIAAMPISRMVVVAGDMAEAKAQSVRLAKLPVRIVPE